MPQLIVSRRRAGMLSLFVATIALCAVLLASPSRHLAADQEKPSLPEWIWIGEKTQNDETVYFRKTFVAPENIKSARLAATCDDRFTLWLNGKETLKSTSWQTPVAADVTKQLAAGENLIAVQGKNNASAAGLLVQLVIEQHDGAKTIVQTDTTWQASRTAEGNWNSEIAFAAWDSAHSVGRLGDAPWGAVSLNANPRAVTATPVKLIQAPEGFRVELLHSLDREQEGSWVALAVDPQGRIYASDQGEAGIFRITPPPIPAPGETAAEPKIELVTNKISMAQGLCWAFDSLYIVVNGGAAQGPGLYRLRDSNGDGTLDELRLLRKFEGGGEHGPHAVLLGPDGKSLYVVGGNHTRIPNPETSRVPRNWNEDNLLPRMWDAGGHAVGIMAPGGWIARTDEEGSTFELVSIGFRNQYDIAFNAAGELFTYDSDMEWDIGTPWYRPTRVNHVTGGSEFGWRSGSINWPDYYHDSLPAIIDIGPGSPTGVVMGTGAKFPARYQNALFIADWSFGIIYAIHLQPEGSSYRAERELFIAGTPLQVTDMVVSPADGAMYFAIGGRGSQSGFYRVIYAGDESTAPVEYDPQQDAGREMRALRHKLEAFHVETNPPVVNAEAIEAAWPHLNHDDRYIRYAARVALEHQPVEAWAEKALIEPRPTARITVLTALCRSGEKQPELYPKIFASLMELNWDGLTEAERLNLLRAYQLAFIRGGKPDDAMRKLVLGKLNALYPNESRAINAELSQLLIYLEAPTVVGRTLDLIDRAKTQEEAMHYIFALRSLRDGWTIEERERYFNWFLEAAALRGGHSFMGFLGNARKEAIENLGEAEKHALADLLAKQPRPKAPRAVDEKREFVKKWTVEELLTTVESGLNNRNYERGRELFAATACYKCHRFAGEGGISGPDLTVAGRRFNHRDMLEAIIDPSKNVSDQYQATNFILSDGRVVSGRVANAAGDNIMVMTNMLEPGNFTGVPKSLIEEVHPSPVSMMPEGLLDVLQLEEILDLLAYIRSGGDAGDEVFKKE